MEMTIKEDVKNIKFKSGFVKRELRIKSREHHQKISIRYENEYGRKLMRGYVKYLGSNINKPDYIIPIKDIEGFKFKDYEVISSLLSTVIIVKLKYKLNAC